MLFSILIKCCFFFIGFCFIIINLEYGLAILYRIKIKLDLKRKTNGVLVLTYDDGPGEELQVGLLTLLNDYDIKATFFLNAERALQYPEQCAILKNTRHEVALHCYKHLHAWRTMPWHVIRDINSASKIMNEWLTNQKLIRFPYGKFTLSIALYFLFKGFRISDWTHDAEDTHSILPCPNDLVERILKNNGGVVILHSFDREIDLTIRKKYVLTLTEALVKAALKNNLKICTYSELFEQ
jgi:peptidoglycan-N-acetylglucosamine deacetylase